MNNSLS